MVVSLPLFPSLSPSRVKHSLEGQRRDVQLVPAGLHAEAASMRPRPSTDAPFVAALIVSQSDGQTGRQDSTPSRRGGRGVGAGLRGAGRAGSLRPGAGLRALHLRAGPAWQERSDCGRQEAPVPPSPRKGRRGCRASSH